uniref:C2H2-type domain-containing protein n=1 Tax=Bursaphelenchus xylophilus TaxID=6326 RepID=A0A1I7SVF0_BURXY
MKLAQLLSDGPMKKVEAKTKTESSENPTPPSEALLAIGGCRRCEKTFTERLELIHHFVDHFPTIFYSFETKSSNPQLLTLLSECVKNSEKEEKLEPSEDQEDLPYHMCPHCCLTFLETHCFEDHLASHLNTLKNTQKPEHIERPESLLNSNPYFKALSKEPCRKRRSRSSKTLKSSYTKKEKGFNNDNAFKMMVDLSNKLLQQLMGQDENTQQLLQMMQGAEKPVNIDHSAT